MFFPPPRNVVGLVITLLIMGAVPAGAGDVEPAAANYVVQGTLLVLPSTVLPDEEGEDFSYAHFDYAIEDPSMRSSRDGGAAVYTSHFARVYRPVPLKEVGPEWKPGSAEYFALQFEPEIRVLDDGRTAVASRVRPVPVYSESPVEAYSGATEDQPGSVDGDASTETGVSSLRIKPTNSLITVPKAPWLPGTEREISWQLPRVYFEGAGDNTVVRRELSEAPELRASVRIDITNAPQGMNDALEAKLEESTVSLEFEDEHISRICEFISDYVDVPIAIDPSAVKPLEATVFMAPPSPPFVTDGMIPYIKLKDVTLQETLRAMCRPLGLAFELRPGYVWITAKNAIETEPIRKLSSDDEVALDISITKQGIAERAPIEQAKHLDIGKPTIRTQKGKLRLVVPLDDWQLIALDSVDSRGANGLYYMLVFRVHDAEKEKTP